MAAPRCPSFRTLRDCRFPRCSRAYIAVTPIDYSKESEIPDKLQNIDGIMSCDSVAGSPSYMLTVRAASPGKLEDLLNVIHQTVPVSTETTIVLQRYFSK